MQFLRWRCSRHEGNATARSVPGRARIAVAQSHHDKHAVLPRRDCAGRARAATAVAQAPQDTARAANAVVPGELVVEPPTLINLGFEWFIEGDDNRNASGGRVVPQAGRRPRGSRRCRCCACRASASTAESRVDVVAPNMFAGSILDLEPDTAYEARFVMSDPDGVRGDGRAHGRTVRTRAEPKPYAGGRVVPRLSARLHGTEDRAGVRRADVRLQLLVRRHRLGHVGPAARAARRHDPRARRRLQVQPLRVHERRGRQSHRCRSTAPTI